MKYDFSHWGKTLPKVSAQCITYGRHKMLEEALQCFLCQDYPGPKEMVIVNDHEDQTLHFNHPEVRIINLKERVATIGSKRNYCVSLCHGSIIFPWDDDDISLPWRISLGVSEMRNHHHFRPKSYWVWNENGFNPIPKNISYSHAMGAFSKIAWAQVGGYPHIQSGQDTEFDLKMKALGLQDVREIEPNYYIYRNGIGLYNLSAFGRGDMGYNIIRGLTAMTMERGDIHLSPHWNHDYADLCLKTLSSPSD